MRSRVLVAALLLALCGCAGTDEAAAPRPPVPAPTSTSSASTSTRGTPTGTPTGAPTLSAADWPAYHRDAARTGVGAASPRLDGTLEVAGAVRLDGQVYASPIVVRGRTVVATENDTVYALDAQRRQLWRTHLGTPSRRRDLPCGNIDPLGITGTPVYDAASGSVLVATQYASPVRHELVALDLISGAVRWRAGLDLPGVDATAMQQRGALTITGGRVWVAFGGLAGDCGAYKGRVVGHRLDGRGAPVAYTVPTTREAGIWTPPGPSVDTSGHLLVAVGNGESGPGDAYDHSDSVLELDGARLVDSFSPRTWASDNAADLDLGSQGPALVGRRWVFIAGKSGTAYVLRQGALGGIGGEVSSAQVCRSFGGTAVDGDVVYVPCTDGLRAVRIDDTGHLRVLWHADGSITGSPVVTGGRVLSLDVGAGRLHALDPATGRSRASVAVGAVTRFATPAVSEGRVLVPTLAGLSVVSRAQ